MEKEVYTIEEYNERKSQLEIDLVTTSVEVSECNIQVSELETCINFINLFLEHPDKFWINLTGEGKLKLNKVLFPNGLIFENGSYRTPILHPVYKEIEAFITENSNKLTLKRTLSNTLYYIQDFYNALKSIHINYNLNII